MRGSVLEERERAELDALLRSGIFHRAPNLANFLQYTCARYFEGQADQIKEYNVAVEGLGRPPEFDQNRDSIVRVEAYRLRKRLKEFYEGQGASHAVKIVIPNGHYAPQFLHDGEALTDEIAPKSLDSFTPPLMLETEVFPASKQLAGFRAVPRAWWAVAACGFAIAIAAAVVLMVRAQSGEVWRGPGAQPGASDYRILAGYHGAPFHDRQGREWQADAFYRGGRSVQMAPGKHFECLPDAGFGRFYRVGNFQYDIPVGAANYEMHLYFIEPEYGAGNPREADGNETARLFSVYLNGGSLLQTFDILSEAGAPNRLHQRVFRDIRPARDGMVHLLFRGDRSAAILSAIEMLPADAGRVRPLRIVAQPVTIHDSAGTVWNADEYVAGGTLVQRGGPRTGAVSGELLGGERYGNFTYHIPVAQGRYRLTLYFAETYFNAQPGNGQDLAGPGARLFNVFANGVALLRDFDVAQTAGGSNRGVTRSFENIEPNAQGKIVLEFNPVHNYAEVNALELVPMD